MAQQAEGLDDVWDDWQDAVTMTPQELRAWLDTDESKAVGDKADGGESTGTGSSGPPATSMRAVGATR